MLQQLRRRCAIANINTAIRIYYEYPELQNAQIKELFGKELADSTLCKYKKAVRAEALIRGVYTNMPSAVNTKLAYEVWGIDVKDLEQRRNKLKQLGFMKA